MKTGHDQTDIWVVGASDDLPCVAVVVNVTPPSQRFIPNPQVALGCTFAKLGKIVGGAINTTQPGWVNRRTYQDKIGSEFLHQVKFAFGPVKGL